MDIKELQENIKVIIKRKGHKEPFDPKKFKRYLMFVTDNDDTMAEILLRDCVVKLKEETKVKVLANAIVDTAVSKISPLQTKWEYVAARAYLLNLYAESYGIKDGRKYPHLNDVLKKGVAAGVYHKDIYSSYTADEINELHEYIRPEEDLTFTYDALKQFVSKYCKDLKKGQKLELPQITYMRVAMGLCYNMTNRIVYIKKLYDILTKGQATLATPIMMNSFTYLNQFSSCILNTIDNSTDDITNKVATAMLYTKGRGGLAFDVSHIQAKGTATGNGTSASGIIPYIHDIQYAIVSMMQGDNRRGSGVITCRWWHYEIEEFLELKDASGGTPENRALMLKYAFATDEYFKKAVNEDRDIKLFCPKSAEELLYLHGDEFTAKYIELCNRPGLISKTVSAKELYKKYLKYRYQTGNIYETMLDNINKANMTNRFVGSSNLCVSGDTTVLTKYGDIPIKNLDGQDVECWNGTEWSLTPIRKTSESQSVLTVTLLGNDGKIVTIEATPYHRWSLSDGRVLTTSNLQKDDITESYKTEESDEVKQFTIISIEDNNISTATYCGTEPKRNRLVFNSVLTMNCQEILEPSRPGTNYNEYFVQVNGKKYKYIREWEDEEIALCNLASYNVTITNLPREELDEIVYVVHKTIDNTIDIGKYMRPSSHTTNKDYRYVGLGMNNVAYHLADKKILFDSDAAEEEMFLLSQKLTLSVLRSSARLAKELGAFPKFRETKWAEGILPIDLSNDELYKEFIHLVNFDEVEEARALIKMHGARNALHLAIAPTASSATSKGLTESIEPIMKLSYTLEGAVSTQVLAPDLARLRPYYQTAYTIDPRRLVKLNAIRQMWIDQSQSSNMYIDTDKWNYGYLAKLHMYAWRLGTKTLYYLWTPKSEVEEACASCSS